MYEVKGIKNDFFSGTPGRSEPKSIREALDELAARGNGARPPATPQRRFLDGVQHRHPHPHVRPPTATAQAHGERAPPGPVCCYRRGNGGHGSSGGERAAAAAGPDALTAWVACGSREVRLAAASPQILFQTKATSPICWPVPQASVRRFAPKQLQFSVIGSHNRLNRLLCNN